MSPECSACRFARLTSTSFCRRSRSSVARRDSKRAFVLDKSGIVAKCSGGLQPAGRLKPAAPLLNAAFQRVDLDVDLTGVVPQRRVLRALDARRPDQRFVALRDVGALNRIRLVMHA